MPSQMVSHFFMEGASVPNHGNQIIYRGTLGLGSQSSKSSEVYDCTSTCMCVLHDGRMLMGDGLTDM